MSNGKKGYWFATVYTSDHETYAKYVAANKLAFDKYGARFLARGGRATGPKGKIGDRNVIIEFDSYETALACYHSPEYQEALKDRLAAARSDFVIVEGV